MTAARLFKPENRLRAVLDDPTAPTAVELVAAAERAVAELQPRLRTVVDRHRDTLAQLAGRPEAELPAAYDALAAAALGICELAPVCGLAAAGEAARGAWTVIAAARDDGVWRADALNAHVEALLRLTADPPPAEAEARAVLARLSGMRAFVGLPT